MRILSVDDEPVFLDIIGATLGELGMNDVVFASCAQDALDKIAGSDRPFDCFLLDIDMPGMNGIGLLREIRRDPRYRLTPIIMVTARSEKSYVDEAFMSGANDYVTKPIDKVEIKVRLGMVQSLLSERAQTGAVAGQLADVEKSLGAGSAFNEPITLVDAHRVMPFASLENYLLKLGSIRMFSCTAVGFHIENAHEIHDRASGMDFVDMLTDVAVTIAEGIGMGDVMMAYVGSGEFVSIMPRVNGFNREEVALQIRNGMSEFAEFYADAGLPLPRIRVGHPKAPGLLSFSDPTSLIEAALRDARKGAILEDPSPVEHGLKVA